MSRGWGTAVPVSPSVIVTGINPAPALSTVQVTAAILSSLPPMLPAAYKGQWKATAEVCLPVSSGLHVSNKEAELTPPNQGFEVVRNTAKLPGLIALGKWELRHPFTALRASYLRVSGPCITLRYDYYYTSTALPRLFASSPAYKWQSFTSS